VDRQRGMDQGRFSLETYLELEEKNDVFEGLAA
jgi:hypothetical protein